MANLNFFLSFAICNFFNLFSLLYFAIINISSKSKHEPREVFAFQDIFNDRRAKQLAAISAQQIHSGVYP